MLVGILILIGICVFLLRQKAAQGVTQMQELDKEIKRKNEETNRTNQG